MMYYDVQLRISKGEVVRRRDLSHIRARVKGPANASVTNSRNAHVNRVTYLFNNKSTFIGPCVSTSDQTPNTNSARRDSS